MRDYNINVEPYDFIDFLELEIHKGLNEHVTARVKGHISEENINKYTIPSNSQQWITINAIDEHENKKIIFKGVIRNIREAVYAGVSTLEIEAISGSYLSDIELKTRTFQDASQTYTDVLNRIKTEENKSASNETKISIDQNEGNDKPIKEFIVQYNETNWQFMKRIASHWNSYLVPEYTQSGCKISFGMPEKSVINDMHDYDYFMEKDIEEYRYKSKNNIPGYTENDAMFYKVETREIYDLCQKVNFKNKELYVAEIDTVLKKGEFIHTYKLQSYIGMKVPKYYNFGIIGASLEAIIAEVAKDNVKVKIAVDNGNAKSFNRWYPYSTVYSSPDGTGWYFMPEEKDSVRVYFPNEKEDDAFIISSVHENVQDGGNRSLGAGDSGSSNGLSSSSQAPRSNPDSKSLSTKFGKQINFNPGNIEIVSGKNLFITITDGEGIVIKSDASITLDAKDDILVQSGKNLIMTGGKGITLAKGSEGGEQGKIEITEDREITLTGKDVKINS